MKRIIIFLALISTLVACNDKYTVQRISDGAILRAYDQLDRDFKSGDTICITDAGVYSDIPYKVSDYTWKDTIFCSSSSYYCWSYAMAIVKK